VSAVVNGDAETKGVFARVSNLRRPGGCHVPEDWPRRTRHQVFLAITQNGGENVAGRSVVCAKQSFMRKAKILRSRRKAFTLGRVNFERISAVEGIRYSDDMKKTFRQLDKQGASPAQRRQAMSSKYGRPS